MVVDDLGRRTLPEKIGRYRILERIGRGAMGVVYRAQDEFMGRDIALKVLTADLEDDPDIRTRFSREAEAAARLSHPNIITIFDVGEDNGRFFIVMELLRGAVLKEFLKRPEAASLTRKLDLMIQLCAGLGAAHNASVCHRDIKPGNIFVRADGILKILDFGVARLESSNITASGFIVGTPDYMSPEQARGADIDKRSDIFSVGGVFYYMLTGRKPFPATDLPTLFHQIQTESPLPLGDEVPQALAAAVLKALSKARDLRYQSCEELMAAVVRIRDEYQDQGERVGITNGGAQASSAASSPVMPSPLDEEPAETDETVDSLPVGVLNTDDTIAIEIQPRWSERIVSHGAELFSRIATRLRRALASAPRKQAVVRKR